VGYAPKSFKMMTWEDCATAVRVGVTALFVSIGSVLEHARRCVQWYTGSPELLSAFPPYAAWVAALHAKDGLVGSGVATLHSVNVRDVFFFGARPGLARINAALLDTRDEPLPGAVFLRGDSAAVLILVPRDGVEHVVLVRQPRVPVGKMLLEIPAGMMDANHNFCNVALRELLEETGIRATPEQLRPLRRVYASPGGSDEAIQYYTLKLSTFSPPPYPLGVREEGEHIEVVTLPLTQAYESVTDGKFWTAVGLRTAGSE